MAVFLSELVGGIKERGIFAIPVRTDGTEKRRRGKFQQQTRSEILVIVHKGVAQQFPVLDAFFNMIMVRIHRNPF